MKKQILQVPAVISKASTMANRVLRLQIDTQENLTDEQISKLISKIDKYGWFVFLEDEAIDESDIINLPELPKREEDKKSPSQRLYNSLYIFWKQQGEKGDFELYYRNQMEKFINAIKERLT